MENKIYTSEGLYFDYKPVFKCPINNVSLSDFQTQVIERLIRRDNLRDIEPDCINTNELEVFIETITAVKEIMLHYNHSRAMEVLNSYINELEKMYYPNDTLEEIVKNMEVKSANRQEEN